MVDARMMVFIGSAMNRDISPRMVPEVKDMIVESSFSLESISTTPEVMQIIPRKIPVGLIISSPGK